MSVEPCTKINSAEQCIQATDFMHCEGSPCWVKCKVAEMCMWGRAKNIMHEGLEVRASYYNRFHYGVFVHDETDETK